MRTFGGWAGALLLGAALGTGCDGGPAQPPGANGGRDGAPGPACAWAAATPELTLPAGEVKGTLRGGSRNPSTTCTRQKVTGGPEAIYLVRLTERALLDIEVVSEMDTVLVIRRVCDDPLTELACSDDTSPLPRGDGGVLSDPVDAGSPLPGPDARNAHLRASLEAGNYFLLVDQAAPFGVGGEFQLKVHTSPPPAQTSRAGAPLVSDGSRLVDDELDLAGQFSPCADGEPRPALFYRAVIPSGQRLIARAVPTAGDRAWTPVLQAFTSYSPGGAVDAGADVCLARDRADYQGQRVLRYVNNGPTDQVVLLSVSADVTVHGARFQLDVAIQRPLQNLTCATALPLSDGQVLRNQDLSEGQAEGNPGGPARMPSLFYSATLYPQQSVHMLVDSVPGTYAPIVFSVSEGCSDVHSIAAYSGGAVYLNSDSAPKTVIVEATAYGSATPPFDMTVRMPLPFGAISVAAAPGLTTTEAGGQATFDVSVTLPVILPVDVPIVSGNPAEGQVSPASLRFTADNWQKPQTVTVTGVDDGAKDGNRPYMVRVGFSISQDVRYAGRSADPVALINLDDEPGFTFDGPAVLQTSESGARSTFRVVLNRAPSATVRLALSSSDEGEGKVDPAELMFEPGNWNQSQTVTVTGIDDDDRDGIQSYRVVTGAATSADLQYAALDPPDLNASNADNDLGNESNCPADHPVNAAGTCDVREGQSCAYWFTDEHGQHDYMGCTCYELNRSTKMWDCKVFVGIPSSCPTVQPAEQTDCSGFTGFDCPFPPSTQCQCASSDPTPSSDPNRKWTCSYTGRGGRPLLPTTLPAVPEEKQIKDLTDAELQTWCTWYGDYDQLAGHAPAIESPIGADGNAHYGYRDESAFFGACMPTGIPVSHCTANMRLEPCTATVGELNDCVLTVIRGVPSPHGCGRFLEGANCGSLFVHGPGSSVNCGAIKVR